MVCNQIRNHNATIHNAKPIRNGNYGRITECYVNHLRNIVKIECFIKRYVCSKRTSFAGIVDQDDFF